MSIDKTSYTDHVNLNTVLNFGKYKGRNILSLLRSKKFEEIRYLLWLREQLNPKGFPRFLCNADIHHTLDQILRQNGSAFYGYKPLYDVSAYDLWQAEKRLELKKKEIQKEEKAKRKREELLRSQEEQRLKDEAIRLRQQQYIKQKEIEKMQKIALQAERNQTYSSSWGDW